MTYFIYTFYFFFLTLLFLFSSSSLLSITIIFFGLPFLFSMYQNLYLKYHLSLSDGICLTLLYMIASRLFNLSVLLTFSFLLKYQNSFKNSSSHIVCVGLLFMRLLNLSLGCCSTVFRYCISGSCFILFLRFNCSHGFSETF